MIKYFLTVVCLIAYLLLTLLPMKIGSQSLYCSGQNSSIDLLAFVFALFLPIFSLPILLSKQSQSRQTVIITIITFLFGYPLVLIGMGYVILFVGWIIALVIGTTGEEYKSLRFPTPSYPKPPRTPGREIAETHKVT
jgi:hypothetical protein